MTSENGVGIILSRDRRQSSVECAGIAVDYVAKLIECSVELSLTLSVLLGDILGGGVRHGVDVRWREYLRYGGGMGGGTEGLETRGEKDSGFGVAKDECVLKEVET